MASNGVVIGRASSVGSFVDASGYKYSEKDLKPSKIKLQRLSKIVKSGKKSEQPGKYQDAPNSSGSSPILPEMDEKIMAAFQEGSLGTIVCKHCKRTILKQTANEHIRGCLRAKQEKAQEKARKKKARDAANRAKEKPVDKDGDEKLDDPMGEKAGDGDEAMNGQKSAKKNAIKGMADEGPKKGKKRKADGEEEKEKEPKKKKKKEEPKPKVPKPKGPVDVEKQCGVTLANGAQCARSLTCKSHPMGAKRAVPGRSLPYDMLLQAYQKKNQARQQKAAIDANAPLQDDYDNNGPVDSDEERDAVMAAFSRSYPRPLVTHTLIPTRTKYQYVRMKEMLSHVLGGARGGGLFSIGDGSNVSGGRSGFQTADSPTLVSPTTTETPSEASKKTTASLQSGPTRGSQGSLASKTLVAASS